MYVVEHYWHSMARRFGEANIPWYNRFEYFTSEKASQVGCNLLREGGAVIVHRQQNSLDGEGGVDRAAEAHERVEQLGDTLKS
jgi:hypothetical protein